MADVSIANLPALVGNGASTDLLVLVDVSDTSESPLGTTKRATFSQINTLAGPVTVNGELRISGPVAGPRDIALQTNGVTRWRIRPNTNVETGSNTGSDIVIDAMADDGTTQLWQVFVRRSTGDMTVPASFEAAGNIRTSKQLIASGAVANDAIGIFSNSDPNGYGVAIDGGGGGRYALQVNDQAHTSLLSVTTTLTALRTTVTIGTDPGGGQLLRVGGSANITGPLTVPTIAGSLSIPTGPVIIGTDPGGTQILRVGGGAAHFQDTVITGNITGSALAVFNTNTTGTGIFSKGGGVGGKHVGQFATVNDDVCLSIQDPAPLTNQTSLLLRCSFVAGTPQVGFAAVLIGPSGSGPGGSGRALYVAL